MNAQVVYIAVAIVALLVIVLLLLVVKRGKLKEKLSPLAGAAFAFVLAGILWGEVRWLGYSLMGVGVLMAVIDIFLKAKQR